MISSMYPGVTVLLSRMVQKEQIARLQAIGIALCLAAVGMIALS